MANLQLANITFYITFLLIVRLSFIASAFLIVLNEGKIFITYQVHL